MEFRNHEVLLRNNTGNKSKASLIEGFVVRTKEFDEISQVINIPRNSSRKQHYLIIGQRGSGKTTLLYRLYYAIEENSHLSKSIVPVMFTEEQYNISELVNLWESIVEYLEDALGWYDLADNIKKEEYNSPEYEKRVFSFLENKLNSAEKEVVLFIENISVLYKKIGPEGQRRLKEILLTSTAFRLIATSTSHFEGVTDYSLDIYNFFKVIQLNGLNKIECTKLLLKIGEQYGTAEEIKKIIKEHPSRVESLRKLTGGVPRTISYLFQIFLDNENGKAIRDLYQLIDTLTLLYKSELDQLSPQQQKVIDVIAKNWDAIAVKEISKITRFESRNISSILATLQKNQVVETVQTNTKNNLYRIKERFMNIWYLMRFGRKHDKDNVIWLVRFYDAWCDESELAKRINRYIDNLKDGQYDINAAIDMGNTFLSCANVSESLKYLLYTTTKSVLPDRVSKQVQISNRVLFNKMNELVEKNEFSQAIDLLNELTEKDAKYYTISAWLYLRTGDYQKSTTAAEKLLQLEPGNAYAAVTLGIVYEDYMNDIPKAEYYLNAALKAKQSHAYAGSRLGEIAFYYRDDLASAIKYHNQAIKRGFKPSLLLLSKIYLNVEDFSQAESLCLRAIEAKIPKANIMLGDIYNKMKKYKNAEDAYLKSLDFGENDALINLGILHRNKNGRGIEKAKLYFTNAIDAGITRGYYLLGKLYLDKIKDEELGLANLRAGVEHGDAESAHMLAHYYDKKNRFDISDDLFLQSMRLGKRGSLFCLVISMLRKGRKSEKKFALRLMEENKSLIESSQVPGRLLYAQVLLWNNKLEESLRFFSNSINDIKSIFQKPDNVYTDSIAKDAMEAASNYILLLLAKEEVQVCLSLFRDESIIDLKMVFKPIYFVLMEYLKEEYPQEYLKAGEEFSETIGEIKTIIDYMKANII